MRLGTWNFLSCFMAVAQARCPTAPPRPLSRRVLAPPRGASGTRGAGVMRGALVCVRAFLAACAALLGESGVCVSRRTRLTFRLCARQHSWSRRSTVGKQRRDFSGVRDLGELEDGNVLARAAATLASIRVSNSAFTCWDGILSEC